jgi:MoaA/NifB/PqqE/SkfB family radical SAM enzyme
MYLPFDFIDYRHFYKIKSPKKAKYLFKKSINLVEIEVFSYCNRKCWFCPNSTLDRFSENIFMEEDSYIKILNELAEINYDKNITYSRYNEPLADKIILERIKQAREILPEAHLMTYCNGDFINKEYIQELYENGLNEINIMAYMGNNEEFTDESAKSKMQNILNKVDLPYEEDIISPGHTYLTKIQYKDMKIRLQSTNFGINGHNRGGLVNVNNDYDRKSPCLFPFSSIYIDYNCNVVPCCNIRSDAPEHKNYVVGNTNKNTIFEIYAASALVSWRKNLYHFGKQMTPCNSCNRGIYEPTKINLYSFYRSLVLKALRKNPLTKFLFKDKKLYNLKNLLQRRRVRRRIKNLARKYKDKKILVYGAGKFFDEMQNSCDLSKLNITGISDMNFIKSTETYHGYKAILPADINNYNPDAILISTLLSYNVEKYIRSILPEDSHIKIEPILKRRLSEKIEIFIMKFIK